MFHQYWNSFLKDARIYVGYISRSISRLAKTILCTDKPQLTIFWSVGCVYPLHTMYAKLLHQSNSRRMSAKHLHPIFFFQANRSVTQISDNINKNLLKVICFCCQVDTHSKLFFPCSSLDTVFGVFDHRITIWIDNFNKNLPHMLASFLFCTTNFTVI